MSNIPSRSRGQVGLGLNTEIPSAFPTRNGSSGQLSQNASCLLSVNSYLQMDVGSQGSANLGLRYFEACQKADIATETDRGPNGREAGESWCACVRAHSCDPL